MYDIIEPCSDSGSYRAEPVEKTRINLEKLENFLNEKDYEIRFSSEVLLLVLDREQDVEVGIYPSGKLLFKTSDEEKAGKLFEEFSQMILNFKS